MCVKFGHTFCGFLGTYVRMMDFLLIKNFDFKCQILILLLIFFFIKKCRFHWFLKASKPHAQLPLLMKIYDSSLLQTICFGRFFFDDTEFTAEIELIRKYVHYDDHFQFSQNILLQINRCIREAPKKKITKFSSDTLHI